LALQACFDDASLFGRKGSDKGEGLLEPKAQPVARFVAGGINSDIAAHRLPRELHGVRVRRSESSLVRGGADPDHEVFFADSTDHIPTHHIGDPTEHLALGYLLIFGLKKPTYSVSNFLIEWHSRAGRFTAA
jgi:hypothetical protein